MKKIILMYGDDKASKLAIKELNSLRFKYQNLISKNNIQILMIQDNQLDEQDKFESFSSIRNIGILTIQDNQLDEQGKFESLPAIRFINDEELLTVEGYNINNSSNYKDYFLDFLKLRELKPFPSGNGNEENGKGEPPIANLNENPDLFKGDEETQSGVSKIKDIEEETENVINEN